MLFGSFFRRVRSPIRYVITRVLANHIHAAITPRPRPRRAPKWVQALASKPSNVPSYSTYPSAAEMGIPRQIVPDQPESVEIARKVSVAPRLKTVSRPAAVKRNGGLRGSTASRWNR